MLNRVETRGLVCVCVGVGCKHFCVVYETPVTRSDHPLPSLSLSLAVCHKHIPGTHNGHILPSLSPPAHAELWREREKEREGSCGRKIDLNIVINNMFSSFTNDIVWMNRHCNSIHVWCEEKRIPAVDNLNTTSQNSYDSLSLECKNSVCWHLLQ